MYTCVRYKQLVKVACTEHIAIVESVTIDICKYVMPQIAS